jgi:DNA-binding CsgD family transcriptional regulator
MEHLQIAYDLFVIMIGLAALSIVVFWAVRTGENDLGDFAILYACFTLVLVVELLQKYLFLNVEDYSARAWYLLSGLDQALNLAVVVATIHFFLGVYGVRYRRAISVAFIVMMVICLLVIVSPIGAVLDAEARTIRFGIGFQLAVLWYFASFTCAIVLGYAALRRAWNTQRRSFLIGLLAFAAFGYLESASSLPGILSTASVTFSSGGDFLYSSIPYALYGIFLIFYFLRYPAAPSLAVDTLPESFLARYGITDREREIILKVIQGKSNADIAGELFISLATVKTHLHNIYRKIDVDSRYDLLAKVRSGQ